MPPQTKTRSLHYKRATFHEGDHDLCALIRAALATHRAAPRRLQTIGDDESRIRVINHPLDLHATCVCGTLVEFTKGDHQATITLAEGVEDFDVHQIAPPNESEEFLQGILFFLAMGNHVIVSASPAVRSAQLESHLDWLLREHTQVLRNNGPLKLYDRADRDTREAFVGVKKIRLLPTFAKLDNNLSLAERRHGHQVSLRGKLLRMVQQWLRDEGENGPVDLALATALQDKKLRATLELSYWGTVPDDGVAMLDGLADLTRNTEDLDVEIELPNVGVIRRGQLRLSRDVTIAVENGMPSPGALFAEMHGWLQQLIQAEEVEV